MTNDWTTNNKLWLPAFRLLDVYQRSGIHALAGLAVRPGFHQHRPHFGGHRRNVSKDARESSIHTIEVPIANSIDVSPCDSTFTPLTPASATRDELSRMDRKLDSRLSNRFREKWKLRNLPILDGLSFAELRSPENRACPTLICACCFLDTG